MVDMSRFKQPVHRSLLQREMLGGIPQAGFLILLSLGLIFLYVLRWYFMIIFLVPLYFFMRHLTKLDQYYIDIFISNIRQKDILIP